MDREREQFFPERYIVKKTVYFDQDKFFSTEKAEKTGKRDRLFSRG